MTTIYSFRKMVAPVLMLLIGLTSFSAYATETINATSKSIDSETLAQEVMPIIFSVLLSQPPVPSDADGDGVNDASDNCLELANTTQLDTDADGFGNRCDPDLNNDCAVNFLDLSIFAGLFLSTDPDADFNGDGTVNFLDLIVLQNAFNMAPGPSGVVNVCSS